MSLITASPGGCVYVVASLMFVFHLCDSLLLQILDYLLVWSESQTALLLSCPRVVNTTQENKGFEDWRSLDSLVINRDLFTIIRD